MAHSQAVEPTRRDFLYIATGTFGGVGAALATWPFISQMNPSASVLALASIEVDISTVQPGQAITVMWRGKPVFIRRRTPKEIQESASVPVSELLDPLARNANFPADAEATDENRLTPKVGTGAAAKAEPAAQSAAAPAPPNAVGGAPAQNAVAPAPTQNVATPAPQPALNAAAPAPTTAPPNAMAPAPAQANAAPAPTEQPTAAPAPAAEPAASTSASGEKPKEKPEWLVVVGVCTHLGCIPLGYQGAYGGWLCPCHGSQYDTAGRVRRGPAPENLAVPPYAFLTDTRIKIG